MRLRAREWQLVLVLVVELFESPMLGRVWVSLPGVVKWVGDRRGRKQ